MALGASGNCQLAEDVAFMMGREMAALGINWNFAPVADIAHQRDNPSVGTRSQSAVIRIWSAISSRRRFAALSARVWRQP